MRSRPQFSGTGSTQRFGWRLQRSANLVGWLSGHRPRAFASRDAARRAPSADAEADGLPEMGMPHAIQLGLPSFEGSDWTPWIGQPTLEELKRRVVTALTRYQGPLLDLRLSGRAFKLDAAGRPQLLEAVGRCAEHDSQALIDIWHAVRSHDATVASQHSRSWPHWPMAARLQLAAMPVIRAVTPALPAANSCAAGPGLSADGVPRRRAVYDANVNGMPLNGARWLGQRAGEGEARPALRVERRIESLWAWRTRWESLRLRTQGPGIEFAELMRVAQGLRGGFALISLGPPHDPQTLAAFAVEAVDKTFALRERRLGSVPVVQATLVGGHALGSVDAAGLARIFRAMRALFAPDLFVVREITVHSPTHQAACGLGMRWLIHSPSPANHLHWTLQLPPSFDAYLQSLDDATRESVRQWQRHADEAGKVRVETITRAVQVNDFLSAADAISRRADLAGSQRLQFDEATRAELLRRAHAGALRAYLMRIDGEPVAFVRGRLRGTSYAYEPPGFVRAHASWSIGTILLMHAIRDLIENSPCRSVDFGAAGDMLGDKSRYANRSTPVRTLEVAAVRPGRGLPLLFGQILLGIAQRVLQRILGTSAARRRSQPRTRR